MSERKHLAAVTLLASMLQAGEASALGLGEMRMRSFLNEPLEAEVALFDTRNLLADEILIRLATREDFDRLGVDRNYFLTNIQFDVRVDEATGQGVIVLSTEQPVLEPYLDIVIEARWPTGRVLREYTVLVDPPAYSSETITVSASERVAEVEGQPAVDMSPEGQDTVKKTEGTEVRMLDSALGPGEMPDRRFSVQTSDTPVAGMRYMVHSNETLWQIASRARPEGVAVQQAMLDIQRLNPEAFIDGNINRIKAGYIIYLPSSSDISDDSLADALAEVRQQNQDWQQSRATPGVTAAASLRVTAAPQPASVPAEAAPVSPAAPAETSGSTGMSARGGDTATAAAAVDSDALARQLAMMSDRLDALEQQVALKDERIAALEAELAAERGRQVAAEPVQIPATAAEAVSEERTSAPAAAPAAAVSEPPAAASEPKPSPRQPRPADDGSFMQWVYAGVAALIAALLGLLVWRRRTAGYQPMPEVATSAPVAPAPVARPREEEEETDAFSDVTLTDEDVDLDTSGNGATSGDGAASGNGAAAAEATETPERDNRGYGENKHDDYSQEGTQADPLAEADIYIAYGRYNQAIDMLTAATERAGDTAPYHLKLIELFVDLGETERAAAQLELLRDTGDSDAIGRAEVLLGAAPAGAVDSDETEFAMDEAPSAEPDKSAPVLDEPAAAQAAEAEASGASVPTPSAQLFEERRSAKDDSVEFSEEDLEPQAPATPSQPAAEPDTGPFGAKRSVNEVEETLEFDLPEDAGMPLDEPAPADSAGQESYTDDMPEFELEFDDLEIDEEAEQEPEPAGTETEETNGDFVIAEDADQMATKLDLARAYIDMGDSDGARSILEEVVAGGDEDQKAEAEELLERIG